MLSNTRNTAQTLQQVDVTTISEGLWPTFLGAYPAQELAWLEAEYKQQVRGCPAGRLCIDCRGWRKNRIAGHGERD